PLSTIEKETSAPSSSPPSHAKACCSMRCPCCSVPAPAAVGNARVTTRRPSTARKPRTSPSTSTGKGSAVCSAFPTTLLALPSRATGGTSILVQPLVLVVTVSMSVTNPTVHFPVTSKVPLSSPPPASTALNKRASLFPKRCAAEIGEGLRTAAPSSPPAAGAEARLLNGSQNAPSLTSRLDAAARASNPPSLSPSLPLGHPAASGENQSRMNLRAQTRSRGDGTGDPVASTEVMGSHPVSPPAPRTRLHPAP
ncbi:unnamed protein product, partial [Ectocarpus sp. 8 AP-2014]